jgi:hypothetical protein
MLDRLKVMIQMKRVTLILQAGGWGEANHITSIKNILLLRE